MLLLLAIFTFPSMMALMNKGAECLHIIIIIENFYRVAQKVSHYQMIKNSYQIVLKPVNDIKSIL